MTKQERTNRIFELRKQGKSVRDISIEIGICKTSVYNILKNERPSRKISELPNTVCGFLLDNNLEKLPFPKMVEELSEYYKNRHLVEKKEKKITITVREYIDENKKERQEVTFNSDNIGIFEQIGLLTSFLETLKKDSIS